MPICNLSRFRRILCGKLLTIPDFCVIIISVRKDIGAWCNGNTWVSKTFVEGSSPSAPANDRPQGRFFCGAGGLEAAGVNDSPVDCQSRRCLSPQARPCPSAPANDRPQGRFCGFSTVPVAMAGHGHWLLNDADDRIAPTFISRSKPAFFLDNTAL